jgi:uncharacterized MnhB-related membrane protein
MIKSIISFILILFGFILIGFWSIIPKDILQKMIANSIHPFVIGFLFYLLGCHMFDTERIEKLEEKTKDLNKEE